MLKMRAGEIVDLIHLYIKRKGHIMTHEFKTRIIVKLVNVSLCTGKQVVGAQHIVPLFNQPANKVRANKPRPSGNQYAFAAVI